MKKLFLSLMVSSFFFSGFSQQWSSHLVTNEIPVTSYPETPVNFGNLRIMPDAVTTNASNNKGVFPEENCVISAYSPSRDGLLAGSGWTDPTIVGNWIIAKDPSGATIMSKRLEVEGLMMRIWSLQYDFGDERELLIFTGSVTDVQEPTAVRMVVGSVDLSADKVSIHVVNQFYGNSYVASQGVGVREISDSKSDLFFAIGQSGDQNNGDITPNITVAGAGVNFATNIRFAAYPIGAIFRVANDGVISVEHTEVKDFTFKPQTVTDKVSTIGASGSSLIAGGMRIMESIEEVCQNPGPNRSCSTHVAAAAYTFDAIDLGGGSWQIDVKNGLYLVMDEFAYSGTSIIGIDWPEIHVFAEDNEETGKRSLFLGMTDLTEHFQSPIEDLMIFKMDIDLSSGGYSLLQEVDYDLNSTDAVYGTFERFLPRYGQDDFDIVFTLSDPDGTWSRNNETSIGFASVPKSNVTVSPLPFTSIYAQDYWGNAKRTEVRNVTGIRVPTSGGDGDHLYLLADGDRRTTDFARAHFNGTLATPDQVDFDCTDNGTGTPRDPMADPRPENDPFPMKSEPEMIDISASIQDINDAEFDCETYEWEGLEKTDGLESEAVASPSRVLRIAEDQYQIQSADEVIVEYLMFDVSGKQLDIRITNNRFNTSGMSSGIYILQYKAAGSLHTEKLVVE